MLSRNLCRGVDFPSSHNDLFSSLLKPGFSRIVCIDAIKRVKRFLGDLGPFFDNIIDVAIIIDVNGAHLLA